MVSVAVRKFTKKNCISCSFIKKNAKNTVSQALRWQGNTSFAQLRVNKDEWLVVNG
jgi:hypothetical protein